MSPHIKQYWEETKEISTKQYVMIVAFAASVLVAYTLFTSIGRFGGWPLVALGVIVLSPISMKLLRRHVEKWDEPMMFKNVQGKSWAFIFGDTIALPIAFAAASRGWWWLQGDPTAWYRQDWWLVRSLVIGAIIGLVFHFVDQPNYIKAGLDEALDSPTKLWHDLVVYPVLAGSLLYLGWPVVTETSSSTPWPWMLVIAVGLWAVLGLLDIRAARTKRLAYSEFHPLWDARAFKRIEESPVVPESTESEDDSEESSDESDAETEDEAAERRAREWLASL